MSKSKQNTVTPEMEVSDQFKLINDRLDDLAKSLDGQIELQQNQIDEIVAKFENISFSPASSGENLPIGIDSVPAEMLFEVCLGKSVEAVIEANKVTMARDAADAPERFYPRAKTAVLYAKKLHEAVVKELLS